MCTWLSASTLSFNSFTKEQESRMKIIGAILLFIRIIQATDPKPSMYPGQLNLGLLAPLNDHKLELVRSAMACVWSVNEVNSRKEARELNLGVHLYDTCNRQDVAQRQVFRMMEYIGHVQPRGCANERGPPMAGVITLGNSSAWEIPVKVLEAFSVPLMTTEVTTDSKIFTTSYSPILLARCLVSLCEKAEWDKVAIVNIDLMDEAPKEFKQTASRSNISADIYSPADLPIRNKDNLTQIFVVMTNNIMAAIDVIKVLQEEMKPVIILTEKIANADTFITLAQFINENVIVLSPERLSSSGFEAFWQEEFDRRAASTHPLISELFGTNETLENITNNISDEIKIVWTFSECLKIIQKKFCNQGSDCVSLIKQSLNSYLFDELKKINFTIYDVFDERNVTVRFDKDGRLATARFNIHLISKNDAMQIGYYDEDDEASNNSLVLSFSEIFFSPSEDNPNTNRPRSSSLLSPPSASRTIFGTHPMENSTDKPFGPMERNNIKTLLEAGLGTWVSRPWSLAVIVLCAVGILSTIYITSFLLMKSCEGALKKRNLPLMFLTLVSIFLLFGSSVPFIFKPSDILCGISRVCHNMSITLLSGCLLLHAMHLRSQELLGLGGRVSRLNQFINLGFIIAVQIAVEVQFWIFNEHRIHLIKNIPFCSVTVFDFVTSQIYIAYIIVVGAVVAFASRNVPYNHREGHCLWVTQVLFLIAFIAKTLLYCFLHREEIKVMVMSLGLIVIGYIILGGIYIPYLYEVHRQGGLPHKPLSYAESMSTVFTMFKQDGDSVSGESTTSRGKKAAKTLDRSDGMVEMTHNPLYDDFRSVYT